MHFNDTGHAHEPTFSCYHRYPFLRSTRACEWLVDAVETARIRWGFSVWAYVFMPDHVHLIVQNRRPIRIDTILAAIKVPVAKRAVSYLESEAPEWLPRLERVRGGRTERLFWQPGGGYDRNIVKPNTLRNMIDYIHMNPVRAGLAEEPSDWRWSSASWYLNGGEVPLQPDRILSAWGHDQ